MMTPEDRAKAVQYEEWSVALFRVFAVKFRLRKERAERQKRTKKREPHVGNRRPILVDHVAHQDRCLDRLIRTLGLARTDVRGLDAILSARPSQEWLVRGAAEAERRMKEDKRLRRCGCHLCDARKDDARWLKGR